jgi:hypothetical protein
LRRHTTTATITTITTITTTTTTFITAATAAAFAAVVPVHRFRISSPRARVGERQRRGIDVCVLPRGGWGRAHKDQKIIIKVRTCTYHKYGYLIFHVTLSSTTIPTLQKYN